MHGGDGYQKMVLVVIHGMDIDISTPRSNHKTQTISQESIITLISTNTAVSLRELTTLALPPISNYLKSTKPRDNRDASFALPTMCTTTTTTDAAAENMQCDNYFFPKMVSV